MAVMKIVAYLIVGVSVGLGLAWWQGLGMTGDDFGPGLAVGQQASIEQRIRELETELRLERFERQALAEQIETLRASARVPDNRNDDAFFDPREPRVEVRERFPDGLPQDRTVVERTLEERQIERFVDAGFAPERARWLLQREDELGMEVLRARYEARQNGASDAEVANMTIASLMRSELGDADYEKYLAGQGRPTSINVREVLSNSPARAAGLEPGDEILSYNGTRVFEMSELSRLTETAKPGSTVVVDIERDGQQLQFYIEGGPLGISGGGRSRRDFGGGR
jgi:hypothetical protein